MICYKRFEAIQFEDTNECIGKLSDFVGKDIAIDYAIPESPIFKIEDSGITHRACVGDWVVKGNGRFFTCSKDIFADEYIEEKYL